MLGMEPAQIEVEIADDLAHWEADIPGNVNAAAEALEGPTSIPREEHPDPRPAGLGGWPRKHMAFE
jgi:hypothetical protein